MRLHVDLVGWFHVIWGMFAVLAGTSLALLAAGAELAAGDGTTSHAAVHGTVWVLGSGAVVLLAFGASNVIAGRLIRARRRTGRRAAFGLVLPNMIVVPFGTALGIYAVWSLLNDEARRQFGRPLRAPAAPGGPPPAP